MPTGNVITFDDIVQNAAELGEQAGKGEDVQIKFMLKVLEGGYHKLLDHTNKNKHGPGKDDAELLSETYFKGRNGSVVFNAKAPNQRKLISIVRKSIQFGSWHKGGAGEPLAIVNKTMTMRQQIRKIPGEAKRLDDAANVLMKLARAQLRRDTLLTDDELRELCFKKQADIATVEDIIERTAKTLDKLVSGSAANGTAQCSTPNIINARHALRQELAAIATARNPRQKVTP